MLVAANLYDFCVNKYIQCITGQQRNQTYYATLEHQDAFIDKLDLKNCGLAPFNSRLFAHNFFQQGIFGKKDACTSVF